MDNVEELRKFKSLLDAGAITEEEFEKQKHKLLGLPTQEDKDAEERAKIEQEIYEHELQKQEEQRAQEEQQRIEDENRRIEEEKQQEIKNKELFEIEKAKEKARIEAELEQKAKQDQAYREQMLAQERERKEEVQNKINNGKNMVITIVGWIVTAFLGLTAISCIIVPPKQGAQHHTYILMGVWLLVLALLSCPPISKYTKKFTTYTKYKFVVVIVAVILFFVSLYI